MSISQLTTFEYKKRLNEYKKTQTKFILTSRFTNETWNENIEYRKEKKHNGCLYSAPDPVTEKIKTNSVLFVLEMNNDNNQILGIGMIRNVPLVNKHSVYKEKVYNRYLYLGEHRIDRKDMDKQEEIVMKAFDQLCFKGNRHMKRGQGLKSFPLEIIFKCKEKLDLVDFITSMFKKRM